MFVIIIEDDIYVELDYRAVLNIPTTMLPSAPKTEENNRAKHSATVMNFRNDKIG